MSTPIEQNTTELETLLAEAEALPDGSGYAKISDITANNLTGTLPVGKGGTGGNTAAEARTNLGAAAENHTHGLTQTWISDSVIYQSCEQTITGFLTKDMATKSFRFHGSVYFGSQPNAVNYEVWNYDRIIYYLGCSSLFDLYGHWWGGSSDLTGYGTLLKFDENAPYIRFHRIYTGSGAIGGWDTQTLSNNSLGGKVLYFEVVGKYT